MEWTLIHVFNKRSPSNKWSISPSSWILISDPLLNKWGDFLGGHICNKRSTTYQIRDTHYKLHCSLPQLAAPLPALGKGVFCISSDVQYTLMGPAHHPGGLRCACFVHKFDGRTIWTDEINLSKMQKVVSFTSMLCFSTISVTSSKAFGVYEYTANKRYNEISEAMFKMFKK